MTRRIVVTGSECTGKTTLATALGAWLAAPVAPEAARLHAERLTGRTLTADDVEPIARLAMSLDDAALRDAPALAVLDTDLISTVVYARHYYGSVPAWIMDEARRRRGDLYLLCVPDLAWTADGVRDRPDTRDTLHDAFARALDEFGCEVAMIRGEGAARAAGARAAILAHASLAALLPTGAAASPAR